LFVTLLPLREKVSAKPTDEGSRRRPPSSIDRLADGSRLPLIRPALAGKVFSRKGEKGVAMFFAVR